MAHGIEVFEKLVFSQIIKKFPVILQGSKLSKLDPNLSQINPGIILLPVSLKDILMLLSPLHLRFLKCFSYLNIYAFLVLFFK